MAFYYCCFCSRLRRCGGTRYCLNFIFAFLRVRSACDPYVPYRRIVLSRKAALKYSMGREDPTVVRCIDTAKFVPLSVSKAL